MDLDEALDELYAADPDDFVDRREQLARQRKDAGAAEDAKALSSMRKPTLPAWAVNQLARRRPQELERLIDAAGRVERAQRGAVSGTSSSDLRESMADLRELSRELTDAAVAFLEDLGAAAESHRDAIGGTLRAAASDPDVREELTRGRLVKPVAAAGFGTLAGLSVAAAEEGGDAEEGGEEADQRAARRSELKHRLRQLRARGDDLERAVDRQRRRVERSEERARRLRQETDEAEDAAEEERRRLQGLTDEHDDVREELDTVNQELEGL